MKKNTGLQIFWSIVTMLLLLAGSFFVILIANGLYEPVDFRTEKGEAIYYCAKEMTGSFSQAGKAQDEVFQALEGQGISTTRGFGIYYDNPKEVAQKNCRFEAGCIIEEDILLTEEQIKTLTVDKGLKLSRIPEGCILKADFPFTDEKILLLMTGIRRGYKALELEKESAGYPDSPVIEIYDMSEKGKETFSICFPIPEENCPVSE